MMLLTMCMCVVASSFIRKYLLLGRRRSPNCSDVLDLVLISVWISRRDLDLVYACFGSPGAAHQVRARSLTRQSECTATFVKYVEYSVYERHRLKYVDSVTLLSRVTCALATGTHTHALPDETVDRASASIRVARGVPIASRHEKVFTRPRPCAMEHTSSLQHAALVRGREP